MEIKTLPVGDLNTNCYLLFHKDRQDALVIDPGAEPMRIMDALEGRKTAAVLLTHGHCDHILALSAFLDCPIYIHEADAVMMTDGSLNLGPSLGMDTPSVPATNTVRDGDTLLLAGLSVAVRHTPGHTPGSVCYLIDGALFTGDTLFHRGYGRTDFPGGDFSALMRSLRGLFAIKENYPIYPGHGESTTVFGEKGK